VAPPAFRVADRRRSSPDTALQKLIRGNEHEGAAVLSGLLQYPRGALLGLLPGLMLRTFFGRLIAGGTNSPITVFPVGHWFRIVI
jgi:hypothetical protein